MDKLPFAHLGRAGMRAAKNYTKGYSEIQTKVREATSNDPWGPSGSQMNIIAQATFNQQDFIEIMETLDKRLNDKGKNWRHVFKSLTLLDYILHAGSENVVLYFQENIYIVKTLREFVFVDEDGKDQGSNVRQKAKDITNLLLDDARIRKQRRSRSDMRDRMSGRNGRDSPDSEDEERRRAAFRRAKDDDNRNFVKSGEDDELARALEESRRMAGMESERANKNRRDNDDLEEALRLSREEEERRKRMLAGNNSSLFDPDAPQNRNEFGWDTLVDNNPPQQQVPMITGFAQFNPYAQQQQEEYMRQQQQEEYMRQQQQLLEMQRQMEYQQQQMAQAQAEQDAYNAMMAQQAYLQQQQQYQAMQAQMAQQQQQPLAPQHTSIGSNNPFAAFTQAPPAEDVPPVPEIPKSSQPTNMPKPILKQPKDDGKHAHLAGLLANRDDGIDTFGNSGQLRYGRLGPQQTGTNPFQRQQQQQQQQKQAEQPFFEL